MQLSRDFLNEVHLESISQYWMYCADLAGRVWSFSFSVIKLSILTSEIIERGWPERHLCVENENYPVSDIKDI